MNELLELVFKLSISGSIFFILSYFLSYFTKKVFSAKWHLYILKINMIFYSIPFFFIYDIYLKNKNFNVNSFNVVFKTIEKSNYVIDGMRYLAVIWLLGVVILTIWSLYCYKKFIKNIRKSLYSDKVLEDAIYKCKLELNIDYSIKVKRSGLVSSPMVIGFINPLIIFPSNMEYSSKLKPVIIHELIHCKRKDLVFKLFQLIISIIHWFNPIVYMMNNIFEKWCEISCDEIVAKNMSYIERKEYGLTILNIIERVNVSQSFLCLYLCSDKKYIKRRLIMMINMRNSNKLNKVFGTLLVCAIIVATLGISVSAENIYNTIDDNASNSLLQVKEGTNNINTNEVIRASVVINTETGEVLEIYSNNID